MIPKLPRLRVKHHTDGSISYWFDHSGKPRHWESLGKDEKVVKRRYDELIGSSKVEAGTVDRMLSDYLRVCEKRVADKEISAGTLANYRGYRKHLGAVFGRPEEITQADVVKYLRKCPRKTFRNEIGLLSMAFTNWMDDGRLEFNPCFGVKVKRKGSKRTRLLTPQEIDAIVAAADERLAVAIELAYATGLRVGDLCALRWADLTGVIDTQKTGARQEYDTTDEFTALLNRARALQTKVGSLYVLCDRRGRKWKKGALWERWDAARRAAGVEDAHFHDLRAAGATEVERGGGDAQKFLGHADARTTMIYLRGLRINVVTPLARKKS